MPQPNMTNEALSHPDAQRMLGIIADLLNGKKRLVIETQPYITQDVTETSGERQVHDLVGYKHTFRVEDSE